MEATKMRKVIVLLSGGADSVATAIKLHEENWDVVGLFFKYGQPNYSAELHLAASCAGLLGTQVYEEKLNILRVKLHEWKENEDAFVPLRNTLFLVAGAAFAVKHNADAVAIGFMKQDTAFFDNSVEHHKLIEDLVSRSSGRKIEILMPWADKTKKDVMKFLQDRKVETVSCWNAKWSYITKQFQVCGKCANCRERIDAEFELEETRK